MLVVINSPFYDFSDPISTIDDAVNLLGYKRICNLAIALSLLRAFPAGGGVEFSYSSFWARAVRDAVACGEIASVAKATMVGKPSPWGRCWM